MDLKVIVSIGLLAVLGFLFYPRDGAQEAPTVSGEWIQIKETLDNEPLHGAKIRKDNPVVMTYDLGYIYNINRAELIFNGSPKDYGILASTEPPKYDRIVSALPTSREYYYPVITFPSKEARWIQVVVNDWYSTRPKIKSTKIGADYKRHSPIRSVRTRYNQQESHRLIDGLKHDSARKWPGANRKEEEVEKDGKKVKEIVYKSPGRNGINAVFDLGISKRIYGVAVTTGGGENNLKQYEIYTSADRRDFQQVYTSGELENKALTDTHFFSDTPQARYVRMTVRPDGWYGKYPEIREVEIYTDDYRPSNYTKPIEEHNAIQVHYDNCGIGGNAQAPNVAQGFPFDRGRDVDPEQRYFLKPGDEVDAKNSPAERSFCYHYDRIIIKYDNLKPRDIYWVQVTYLQAKDDKRIQSLDVDGFILSDGMSVPANVAEKMTYAIPPAAYADGEIELHFNRLAGPNAVVSEVALLGASEYGTFAARYTDIIRSLASAPRTTEPVVIDGVFDEWPGIYPMTPQQYTGDPADSPVKMFVQWDDDNLYIAFRADRGELRTGADPSSLARSSDILHVFIDASLTRSPGMYREGDHHFRFMRLGTPASERRVLVSQIHHHADAIPKTIEDNRNVEVAATLVSETSGYTLEARIPKDKALYKFAPQSGGIIGFNYILGNPSFESPRRGGADRQRGGTDALSYPLSWATVDVSASPEDWGTLELVGSVSGQPAIMDQSLTDQVNSFRAGDELALFVRDPDRNTDRNLPQSIEVTISGDLTKDSKEIVLHETTRALFTQADDSAPQKADNSDIFAGKIATRFGTEAVEGSSALIVQGKETITLEYLDPYYGPDQNDVMISYTATVEVGTTATVSILDESGEEIKSFNAGDILFFKVIDKDPSEKPEREGGGEEEPPPPEISVTVNCAGDTEKVTLIDEENLGTFTGSINTVYSREDAADGILQVEGYDIARVTYVDPIQATGNTNVPVEAEAIVSIGNTGLLFVGRSSTGKVDDFVDTDNFNAGQELMVMLRDGDVNVDRESAEQVSINISGNTVQDSVTLNLTETSPNSGVFAGVLKTAYSVEPDTSNDVLEVRGSETVTFTYEDSLQASGATDAEVSKTAVVNIGNDGVVSILRSNYFWELEEFNAGDRLYIKVDDADLNLDPGIQEQVEVSVSGDKTLDGETAILQERNPNSGVFFGSIGTEYAQEASNDEVLQVQGNEIVTVTYLDELQETGKPNVPIKDTCKVSVGTTGRITVYNKMNPYEPIAGYPDEGWKNRFKAGDTLLIRLEDMDLNVSSAAAEIFQVSTTEDVIRDSVSIILTEVSGSAGVFTGEVRTEYGLEAIPGDGVLQVQGEGRVNIFYRDTITSTGETEILIPVTLTVATGEIGILRVLSTSTQEPISSFSAGDDFVVWVSDGDLNTDPRAINQATVIIRGSIVEDELQILLQETELDSGIFAGRVQSVYSQQADLYDSVLQVAEKELLTLTYIDEVGVTGETDMPISTELVVRSGTAGSLIITDENRRELANFNAGRRLYFRLDDFVLSNTSPNTPAQITVQGDKTMDSETVMLEERPGEQGIYIGSIPTNYGTTPIQDGILQVRGGETISATYIPRTPGAPDDPITDTTFANEGYTGKITITGDDGLKLTNFNAGDTLSIRLEDFDLNMNDFAIETADVWIVGDAIAGGKTITLKETSENSGVFVGSIETRYGRGVFESRNILEVVGGEEVTAVYSDALNSLGETDVRIEDSCRANMLGTAPYASQGVDIDGSLSEWPLENALRAGDGGSNIYVQWDRDNLYILAYISDTEVVVPDATQFWDGADALEIHIDIAPTSEISPYLQGLKKLSSYVFWFCPKGAGPDGNKPYVGQSQPETIYNYTEIQTAVRIFPNSRYILEARIPFDPVLGGFDPYKTGKGEQIGFNYVIRRSDAPQLRWAATTESESNLPLSYFGTLILEQP